MKQIFINLPVQNPERAMQFYKEIGFTNYALFTDSLQKCMVWSDHIYVMLIAREKFASYHKKPFSHSMNGLDAYFTLPLDHLEAVHEIMDKGIRAGGTEPIPMIDEGFMQLRRLTDLDGHNWDFIFLDKEAFQKLKAE